MCLDINEKNKNDNLVSEFSSIIAEECSDPIYKRLSFDSSYTFSSSDIVASNINFDDTYKLVVHLNGDPVEITYEKLRMVGKIMKLVDADEIVKEEWERFLTFVKLRDFNEGFPHQNS